MSFLSDPLAPVLLLAFVAGLVLTVWLLRAESRRNPLHERLGPNQAERAELAAQSISLNDRAPLSPALNAIAAFGQKLAGTAQDRLAIERLLAQAGWRRAEATGLFMAAKYGSGVLLCAAGLWLFTSPQSRFGMSGLAVGLVALFVGTTLPELVVKIRAARRHEALTRSMPDALDLMVICAEAGLPFPRILKVVSRELAFSAPAMADELAYTSAELQLLPDRAAALRHLADRTRVPTIESMVGSLLQAERYGTPLAQALRTIAEESRSRLILELEEKAGKLPAQLSVPLMTLILPPVVAIVATPALMRVIRTLMQ
ncbi:Type II/IV secretion system protein TadC, associated with Flp pilus assembly [plant metagenome]|uniref:Type II/IV secretion system protein TadC, associated with Flp pilus assembly n=2 Tax=root TaxID=1 RepID=A0A1C3JXR9_9BURK|nr:type II secretion system F family protein [Orrella dioscoreae]SBT23975.1 Type II/IV secretion system protein TadC, associated with Flp pilus assembly [Orrella dioscoreae]SOE47320.1 Type II/IV secretion system protein TadC, associated with Flp pilus assembly [Orrella dioscoreae]